MRCIYHLSLLALGLWLSCISLWATPPDALRFRNYGLDTGIRGSMVYDIFCDRDGLMWIGSESGLTHFDGRNTTAFRADPRNPDALYSGWIRGITQDAAGDLWVATRGGGLSKLDHQTMRFQTYRHDPEDGDSLAHDDLYGVVLSHDGRLWTFSYRGGLDRMDPVTERFEHIDLAALFPGLENPVPIQSLFEDSRGYLYIGSTKCGLLRWHPERNETLRFPLPSEANPDAIGATVLHVTEDKLGSIWVGSNGEGLFRIDPDTDTVTKMKTTHDLPAFKKPYGVEQDKDGAYWVADYANGLFYYDPKGGETKLYQNDPAVPFSLSMNDLMTLALDHDGGVWVGSRGAGVHYADPDQVPFKNYYVEGKKDEDIAVNAATVDEEGQFWIGGMGSGIRVSDLKTFQFKNYEDREGLPPLVSPMVKTLAAIPGNKLAVGYFGAGLQIIDLKTGQSQHMPGEPKNPDAQPMNRIGAMVADGPNGLWLAGYAGGLHYLHLDSGKVTHYVTGEIAETLRKSNVTRMRRGPDGSLWMGSVGAGLFRFNPHDQSWGHWDKASVGSDNMPANDVLDMYPDPEGYVWLVGRGLNLIRLHPESGAIKTWDYRDGFKNDTFTNLLQCDDGLLWLVGIGEFTMFDTRTETIRAFYKEDGFEWPAAAEQSGLVTPDGILTVVAGNDLMRFESRNVAFIPAFPEVVLNDISLDAQSISRGKDRPHPILLKAPIDRVPAAITDLTLTHNQRMVGFQFGAAYYQQPNKLRYRYRLVGFNDTWYDADPSNPQAVFTELNAGEYRLEVQATSKEGVWGEKTKEVALRVLPPIWLTSWAKMGYGLLVLLLLGVYLHQQRTKLEGQRRLAQQEKEIAFQANINAEKDRALAEEAQKVAARLSQLDKLKDEFLANTSHELRTPLQGIIGMAEALASGGAGPINPRLTVSLNILIGEGRRLAHLVNDLLDFSQLRHEKLVLDIKAVDLRAAADLVVSLTQPRLRSEDVVLRNQIPADLPAAAADENRLQQIIHNLVGNAVKFTERGTIVIDAVVSGGLIAVSVRDTGIGIAEDKLATIFNHFEQADGSAARSHGGTGLGLSISKALVGQHGGTLRVESEPGRGSVFTFTLPLAGADQQCRHVPSLAPPPATLPTNLIDAGAVIEIPEDSLHVLVVDDEPINRHVLRHHLESQGYRVSTVSDGYQALAAIDNDIDLILLDVMMPGLTGYEVAQMVREDHSLQDLPIIFLTAKTGLADLMAAFQYGANDFLIKPVAKEELLTRMRTQHQLLDLHRNLEDKVKRRTKQLAERTREVENQHQELQYLYRIVRTLNGLARLDEIFEALLHHGLQLFDSADRAALIVRDGRAFRFAALVGHEAAEAEALAKVRLDWEQLVRRYVQSGSEMGDGIFRLDNSASLEPLRGLSLAQSSQSLVVLALKVEAGIEGFLVFSNVKQRDAFSDVEVQRLTRFREHATAAMTRARLVNAIEKQKEEILRNQEIILRQEKLASLGTMTAGIAHEINNPNNFIAGGSQSLSDEINGFRDFLAALLGETPDPEIAEAFDLRFNGFEQQLGLIRLGSQRIGKIVGDLLRLTQLDARAADGVNLYECVLHARRAVAPLYPETTFEIEIDADLTLHGRAEAFDHVFRHLLSNAGAAVKKAGHGEGRVVVRAVARDQRILATVEDNGCGIEPAVRSKLFDAFYTTGEIGAATGLGLFTSHQIIKDCGGEISVTSRVGVGTTFSLTFPNGSELEGAALGFEMVTAGEYSG